MKYIMIIPVFVLGVFLAQDKAEASPAVFACYSAGAGAGSHIFCGTCSPVYYGPSGPSSQCESGIGMGLGADR